MKYSRVPHPVHGCSACATHDATYDNLFRLYRHELDEKNKIKRKLNQMIQKNQQLKATIVEIEKLQKE